MNWEQGAYILTDYLRLLGHEEMLMIVDTAKLEGDKKMARRPRMRGGKGAAAHLHEP